MKQESIMASDQPRDGEHWHFEKFEFVGTQKLIWEFGLQQVKLFKLNPLRLPSISTPVKALHPSLQQSYRLWQLTTARERYKAARKQNPQQNGKISEIPSMPAAYVARNPRRKQTKNGTSLACWNHEGSTTRLDCGGGLGMSQSMSK